MLKKKNIPPFLMNRRWIEKVYSDQMFLAPPSLWLCALHSNRDDEHALILQYCQTLGGTGSPCSQPQSPAQILQAVEREERGELERIIAHLEDEQRFGNGYVN